MQTKDDLRAHFLSERKRLSTKEMSQKSARITQSVIHSPEFQIAEVIHCYITISKNREVDTTTIIRQALDCGKKVIVPKTEGEGILSHHKIETLSGLVPNNLGIPEPKKAAPFPVSGIDLVIVPMVAGDRQKNRLGYGKGYYDRFLEKCPAIKAGLLFDLQLYSGTLPAQPFDIPLDILFTENQRIG